MMADEGPKGVTVVQPGDTLLIGFDRILSDEELGEIRSRLLKYLPEGVMVVVKGSDGE